jgi:VWFA-related protein
MTRTVGLAAAAMATWALAQDPQQAPVFRSTANVVMVDVSVRDSTRRVIDNLTASDFTVLDNGVAQQVDELSSGKLPIDVTVGLDISGSVGGPLLDRLRLAVNQLMGDLRRGDRLKLMVFNMRFSQTIDFTTDVSQIDRAIKSAGAAGGTALYDAMSVALITASEAKRRQLVIFFTDGNDTSSTTPSSTLLTVAERSRATVSFVVLPTYRTVNGVRTSTSITGSNTGPPAGGSASSAVPPSLLPSPSVSNYTVIDPALNRLALDTGGVVIPVGMSGALGPTFLQVLDRFRSAYVLFYTPRGVDRGGFHSISVSVSRPGAIVEARRGYFAD